MADFPGGTGSSIILDGPAGCGKHTAAFDIAMGLFCVGGDQAPCGTCAACVRMQAGSHPDYHVLRFEGKAVKVEEVRAIRAQTFIMPSEAPFKIIVIEHADKLSIQGQNTLLKVLEEQHSTQFILLCENREALLQTVRSRCVTFRLEPLTQEVLKQALLDSGHHPQDVERALAPSNGFLGQALDFLGGDEPKWSILVRQFLQAIDRDELGLYTVCIDLGKLGREEYAAFCNAACTALLERTKSTCLHKYISIFDAIAEQSVLMPYNPSPVAMAGALAAHCAQFI